MENPIKIHDLWVPLFLEPCTHLYLIELSFEKKKKKLLFRPWYHSQASITDESVDAIGFASAVPMCHADGAVRGPKKKN